MHKIAIFVEGQTEQIFVKKLIEEYIGYKQGLQIKPLTTRGKNRFISFHAQDLQSNIQYFFLIVNVGNDETVVSDIKENSINLFDKGFIRIIGLRDLYPFRREGETKVLKNSQKVLKSLDAEDKIKICLAVMEIEAWFLADHSVFEKIDPILIPSYIKGRLDYDLINDDPQITHRKPTDVINRIFQLVGRSYKKREAQSYEIVERLDYNYL